MNVQKWSKSSQFYKNNLPKYVYVAFNIEMFVIVKIQIHTKYVNVSNFSIKFDVDILLLQHMNVRIDNFIQ